MAIFGAGSLWDKVEKKEDFFRDENYVIGWDILDAQDLYNLISTFKIGDIIYLKSNQPGSNIIKIKGIGIVTESLLSKFLIEESRSVSITSNYEFPVKWIVKEEFVINIPSGTGKLTNVRAATLYEENLPFVCTEVLHKIFSKIK